MAGERGKPDGLILATRAGLAFYFAMGVLFGVLLGVWLGIAVVRP